MTVIEISPKNIPIDEARIAALRQRGLHVTPIQPSWLSAITSMNIAHAADKIDADEVVVSRIIDAVAAISARKIVKRRFRIVYRALPNSEVPRSFTDEVCREVDRWVFPSQRLLDLFPTLPDKQVVVPEGFDPRLDNLPIPSSDSVCILWFGPIDGNITHLKEAIEIIGNADLSTLPQHLMPACHKSPNAVQLRILGTGKARYAMQAVRASRGVKYPERIVWLGDSADLTQEVSTATHVLQSGLDPEALELQASSSRPLITINELRTTNYELRITNYELRPCN